MDTQRCPGCGEEKPESGYTPSTWGTVGIRCRDCRSIYMAQWHRAHPLKSRTPPTNGIQRCPACGEDRGQDDYGSASWGRLGRYCRTCMRSYDAQRRQGRSPIRRPVRRARSQPKMPEPRDATCAQFRELMRLMVGAGLI